MSDPGGRRRRVLLVHPAVHVSGAGKSWILLVRALREACEVWTSTPAPYPDPEIDHRREVSLDCPQLSRRWGSNIFYFLSFPYFVLRYSAAIARLGIDVVHCNGVYLWQPMLAAKLCRRRLVVHVREAAEKYPLFLYKAWVFCSSALADRIICVSKRDRAHFSRPDVETIPNWFSIDDYERELAAGALAQPDAGSGAPAKLLVVSQIIRGKGQDFAVDVLAELRRRGTDAVLHFAGGTHGNPNNERYKADLLARIARLGLSGFVVFLGEAREVLALMRLYAVLLIPSPAESFSRLHLEAMYAGIPLVTTDAGSARDLIEDGRHGFVVGHGDAAAAADRIETLLSEPQLRERLAVEARRKVVADYGDGRHARAFSSLILSVSRCPEIV